MKATEARLEELRRSAAAGALDAPSAGYHGLPLLKPPVWTWEVPLYFFAGGAAGAAAMIGFAARVTGGDATLVRDARRLAALGAVVSGPLLIADLGRPSRFLNMLRIFKPQSPMSVGAWTLAVFGAAATGAVVAPGRPLRDAAAFASAASGIVLSTYTGVLLGATAVPEWSRHVATLPIHFAAGSVGTAACLLELRGHDSRPIRALAAGAAVAETALRPKQLGALLAGPLPLALRVAGGGSRKARRLAALSAIAGSLLTRFEWIAAGRESTKNPKAVLAPPPPRV